MKHETKHSQAIWLQRDVNLTFVVVAFCCRATQSILPTPDRVIQFTSQMGNKFKELHGVSIGQRMKEIYISGKSSKFLTQINSDINA